MSIRQLAIFPMAKKAKRQKTQVLSARVGGSLAACTVKLAPRVSRETNLRLIELARQVSMRPAALQAVALDSISRIPAAEFFEAIADLRKRAS